MAADVVKVSLLEELEKAKESLKDVDENIKKLTGRDPNEARLGVRRISVGTPGDIPTRGRERLSSFGGFNRRDSGVQDGPPANKRRSIGGAFSRLGPRVDSRRSRGADSGDDEELPRKPTLQSSVVATPKEVKSRKDCLEEQKSDSRGLQRNRRMFGLLLGTLQKFKVEEHKKKEKEQKRMEIEQKLEAAAEKEKEELKRERQGLFLERRKRQGDLRRLEQKMDLLKQQDEWEAHHKQLMNFIQTKTKPPIFYLPAKHNLVTEERLKNSRKKIQEAITQRRAQTDEEVQAMDQSRMTNDAAEAGDAAEIHEVPAEDDPMPSEEAMPTLLDEGPILEDADEGKENNPGNDGVSLGKVEESVEVKAEAVVEENMEVDAVSVDVADAAKAEPASGNDVLEKEAEQDGEVVSETFYANEPSMLAEKEFEPIYD